MNSDAVYISLKKSLGNKKPTENSLKIVGIYTSMPTHRII